MKLGKEYWQNRWKSEDTPWDIGYASPAIINFLVEKVDKQARILIPGCGNAYEAEALLKLGFTNVHIVDLSSSAIESFQKRVPSFPVNQIHCANFFDLNEQYDVVVEQTFFCALNPTMRGTYARKMNEILEDKGQLIGLLFNVPLNEDKPPFGGDKAEYKIVFSPYFNILEMDITSDSIKPRAGRELFICLEKK